ncbi:MAG: hypothetical protein AAF304_00205 [Pseudomonadota bacterium]
MPQAHFYLAHIAMFSLLLLITACATQYEADADADQLVAAMQELPEVKPYLANVHFYPKTRSSSTKIEVDNGDERNLHKIVIPEDEMLNLAGHASIFRWFQDDGKHTDLPLLNIHARIYKLDHSIRIVNGRMQPIAKTKIEVFLTDKNDKRIYESVFTAQGEGQEGKILRNKRETQDIYGQAIYKAMVLAFETAFADISNDLNLRPIDFDIDKIKLEEDIEIDDIQNQKNADKSIENIPDATVEDT